MLNYIWGFMILVGILYGSLTGNIAAVGNGILDSAKEAVSLCITMLGVMALWTGIMEIASDSGLIKAATKKIIPVIRGLFPGIPQNHKAWEYISLNIIANILGLGWAATPAGLKAMEELQKVHVDNCKLRHAGSWQEKSRSASNAMCAFLVINISSLQLIPVNIIAYRSQYGSVNPAVIVAPSILATGVSTLAAVIYCMIKNKTKEE
ncbi:MAG: hypothetical protein PUF12_02360 [Thermoflexaceae bacterium]|nr:hypothetical protein [Thermoflexaceae bacterium]